MESQFPTNEEIIRAAKRNMNQAGWDYLVGGTETETSMRRNRLSLDKKGFRPRILVDVSNLDTSTTLLGYPMQIPVILAPIGGLVRIHPNGPVEATKSANEFGVIHTLSSVSGAELETVASDNNSTKFFQMYIQGDWDWIKALIDRVKKADFKGLALTVDNARYSLRERPLKYGTTPPGLSPRTPGPGAAATWELMDKIKDYSGLPFMVKGIATPEDARIAVDHGVEVIWISNHGGRGLDHGLGTLDMLEAIVPEVTGKAELIVDGSILRGSDVVKAVALGANAVSIGKLQGWGLAAGGAAGLTRTLQIMEEEIISAMALLGVTRVDQLNKDYITSAEPVAPPHEYSTWVNMPEGRML